MESSAAPVVASEPTGSVPAVAVRCPWCDSPVVRGTSTQCPNCSAVLTPAAPDLTHPGLTALPDDVAALRERTEVRKQGPARRTVAAATADVLGVPLQAPIVDPETEAPEAFASPSDDVRSVMRQLAWEAYVAQLYVIPPGELEPQDAAIEDDAEVTSEVAHEDPADAATAEPAEANDEERLPRMG